MSNSTIQLTARKPGQEAGASAQRYRVLKTLGSGGMGNVYLAEDLKLPRRVAIKTIRKELCENTEIRKRIERECQLHAKIGSHPHIVTLYDQLEEGDQISLVMEYVEGQTLRDVQQQLAQAGTMLPWRQSVTIICQCLDALARIHAHGIVHRDVKPANILLGRDDSGRYCAKLMDFGIARPETQDGTALTRQENGGPGTPLYMAPEQIDSQTFGPVSPATDTYAIGIVLYHLLSGKLPFEGSITQILTGHLTREPPPLTLTDVNVLPPVLRDILKRSLKKLPQERFASARAFREALEQVLHQDEAVSVDKALPGVAVTQIGGVRTMLTQAEDAVFKKGATQISTTHPQAQRSVRLIQLARGGVLLIVIALAAYFMLLKPVDKQSGASSAKVAPPVKSEPVAVMPTPQPPAAPIALVPEKAPEVSVTPAPLPTTDPARKEPASPPLSVMPPKELAPAPTQPSNHATASQGSALDVLKQLRPSQEEPAALGPAEPPVEPTPPKVVEPMPPKPIQLTPSNLVEPTPPKTPAADKPKVTKPKVATEPKKPKPPAPRAASVQPSKPPVSSGGGWGDVRILRDETYRR